MSNLAGKCNFLLILIFVLSLSLFAQADDEDTFQFGTTDWREFAKEVELQKQRDRRNGLSYIISGSLALVGGIVGASVVEDPAEKGIYSIFQTIGVASVGYGAYVWHIGGEERSVHQTLSNTRFTPEYKSHFLKAYEWQRKDREKRERYIRAVTHGLIAGLNFYNGSQQTQESLKNTLYFIGGVNALAAISFTLEF